MKYENTTTTECLWPADFRVKMSDHMKKKFDRKSVYKMAIYYSPNVDLLKHSRAFLIISAFSLPVMQSKKFSTSRLKQHRQ